MTQNCPGNMLVHDDDIAVVAGLTDTVYGRLQDSGFFFDPVQREVEQQVMPWLKEETEKIVARHATARYVPPPLYRPPDYAVKTS